MGHQQNNIKYLDLFAGAGGLSEGFMRAGFTPIAHIEMDRAACYTLKTRLAYKWLTNNKLNAIYDDYLDGKITRKNFYSQIPHEVLDTVMNYEISWENIAEIFLSLDKLLNNSSIQLLVGGPPCQAYSLIGRARDENKMKGDKRNYLYILYAEFLRKYKPEYFVFENVEGLLSAKDSDGSFYFTKMKELFISCGYSVEHRLLNAIDYGVLQNRRRIILIGKRGKCQNFYPAIPTTKHNYLVNAIFEDLPKIMSGEGTSTPVSIHECHSDYLYFAGIKKNGYEKTSLHFARPNKAQDLEIYKLVVEYWYSNHRRLSYVDLPENLRSQRNMISFLDRFKVVADDVPYSQTVVAHLAKDGNYFIHPDLAQNRSITPREAARLQTFPDDYYFESHTGIPSRTAAFRQIGNAVPVLLAEQIAKALLEAWT